MHAAQSEFEQALASLQGGKLADAEVGLRAILAQNPRHANSLHYLGVIAFARQQWPEALRLIGDALNLNPHDVAALTNRGNVALKMGDLEAALADYDRALAIDPLHPDALSNRGHALTEMGRLDEALAALDRALNVAPAHAAAQCNRGNTFLKLERREDAVAAYGTAIAADPTLIDALFNRGKALLELGRPDEAIADFDRIIALNPAHPEAHWTKSLCHLLMGDLARGWEIYEWRWRVAPQKGASRKFSTPLWLGEQSVAGRTLLLHAEQGFGDTIQFCRYAAVLTDKGANVILEVQPELKPLLKNLRGAAQVIAAGDAVPPHDYHCPLLSAPLALKTVLADIPPTKAYVRADERLTAIWRERLGAARRPRIGLAWSGRPNHPNDRHRSMAPEFLAPLLSIDVELFSLQKTLRPQDRAWLKAHPEIRQHGEDIGDFSDTAALVSLLDGVVTVDTSVAHLSGALGVPVWIMLPAIAVDWRWMLKRGDSPWYPTARLIRQSAMGGWAPVVAQVVRELHAIAE